MYSHALIGGVAGLFVALAVFLGFILIKRIAIAPAAQGTKPIFSEEFVGELTKLSQTPAPQPAVDPVTPRNGEDAYTLHKRGESSFRIASRLGISKADAELLIKVEDARRRS